MKVLFIGGTGNISGAVSRLALRRPDMELHLLTRGKSRTKIDGAGCIAGDINDPETVKERIKQTHWGCVVNWIAFNPPDIQRDIEIFSGNTDQYFFISSASVYETPPPRPFITESSPTGNPHWRYSRDKIRCEEVLNRAYREKGFPFTIVRLSLTYDTVIPLAIGGFHEYTVIDRMKKGKKVIVHGDGTSLWTVTHAEDFARGFVGLMGNPHAVGHAFHITTDEVLTWNRMYEFAGDALGVRPRIVHIPSDFIVRFMPALFGSLMGDKSASAMFDNSKIKRFVPEFEAVIPFKEGIKTTIARFEADPDLQIVNPDTDGLMDRVIELYESAFYGKLD